MQDYTMMHGPKSVKLHILCSITFLKNIASYEIMWKNILEPDRLQMTVWYMHIAYCVPKATNTHSQYLILIVFSLQQWLYARASMLRCTCIACLISKDIRMFSPCIVKLAECLSSWISFNNSKEKLKNSIFAFTCSCHFTCSLFYQANTSCNAVGVLVLVT